MTYLVAKNIRVQTGCDVHISILYGIIVLNEIVLERNISMEFENTYRLT